MLIVIRRHDKQKGIIMEYSFAPMEGITGFVYRSAFNKYFGGADRYYTPFIAPNMKTTLNSKVIKDILPENNKGIFLIPQILTNDSAMFTGTARALAGYGYGTVNLNLGCPSGTVASKAKGAGFLREPDRLEKFLDEIFSAAEGSDYRISIKTRVGVEEESEFERLMTIYEKYPIEELVVHPRLMKDYYGNEVRLGLFDAAYEKFGDRVCYNGDICSAADEMRIEERCPRLRHVMIGRGLLKNPGLLENILFGHKMGRKELHEFMNEIFEGYLATLKNDISAIYKMKELWAYLAGSFEEPEKCLRLIRKADRTEEYRGAVSVIFSSLELTE